MRYDQTFYRKELKQKELPNRESVNKNVSLEDIGFPDIEIGVEIPNGSLADIKPPEVDLTEEELQKEIEKNSIISMLQEESSQKTTEVRFREYWTEIEELLSSEGHTFLDNIFPNPLNKTDDLYGNNNVWHLIQEPEFLEAFISAHQRWIQALDQHKGKIFVPENVITQAVKGYRALKIYFRGQISKKVWMSSPKDSRRENEKDYIKEISECCQSLEALVGYLQTNQIDSNQEIIRTNQYNYKKTLRQAIGLTKKFQLCKEHVQDKNFVDSVLVASAIYHASNSGSLSLILTHDKKHIPIITEYCIDNLKSIPTGTTVRVVVPERI